MNTKLENYLRDKSKDIKGPLMSFLYYYSTLKNTDLGPLYVNLVDYYNKKYEGKREKISKLTKDNISNLELLSTREIIEQGVLRLSPVNFRQFYSAMFYASSGHNKSPSTSALKGEHQEKMVNISFELDRIYKSHIKTQIKEATSYDDLIERLYGGYFRFNEIVHDTDKEDTKTVLKGYAHKQIFSELFFSDTYRNVYANMNALRKFEQNYDINKSPKISRKYSELKNLFYKDIQELGERTEIRTIRSAFYDLLLTDLNFQETLYETFRYAKNVSSKTFVDSCTDFTKFPCEVCYGVPIYKVKKSKYQTLVSVTDIPRDKVDYDEFKQSKRSDIISCSYVDDKNLITFKDLRKYIAVVYDEFPANQLEMISENDSYTSYEFGDLKLSSYQYSFLTPEKLTELSGIKKEYNECTIINPNRRKLISEYPDIANKFREVRPSYVFCLGSSFDETPNITPNEIDFARKLGVPIVYVENDNYKYYGETLPQYGTEYDQTF